MKRLIIFTTSFVLFVVLIVPIVMALRLNMIPFSEQPGYDSNKRLSIYASRDVHQVFVSKVDSLTAIGTSVRNPNLNNRKDIIFSLFDDNNSLVRKSILNGQNVEDGAFIRFVFDPVTDSKNKLFSFTLSSPDAGPVDTIEVFYTDYPTDNILNYSYDKITYPGGLPVVEYRKPLNKWGTVKEIFVNLFSRLLHLDSQKTL